MEDLVVVLMYIIHNLFIWGLEHGSIFTLGVFGFEMGSEISLNKRMNMEFGCGIVYSINE